MLKIVKSSYVKVGAKKEIGLEAINIEEGSSNNSSPSAALRENEQNELLHKKMQEIEAQINQKLLDAEVQAQKIIADAYEDAKTIYENAKQEGYIQGKQEGYALGKSEADGLIEEALGIKRQLQATKEEVFRKAEEDIVALIIDITEKILNNKIEESYETILGLVEAALNKCTYTESLILRVSPEDYGYVISAKNRILSLAENIDDIHIKQDASLKKGGCVIDTISGSIDASIETQFNHIKSLFDDLLGSE